MVTEKSVNASNRPLIKIQRKAKIDKELKERERVSAN